MVGVSTGSWPCTVNIETIGDLANKSKSDLYRKFNLGEKSLREIAEALSEYGLRLKEDT